MPQAVDKVLVRDRFRRCLATYDAHATVQRQMADRLVQLLRARQVTTFPRALEVGSGTGMLTRRLLENFNIRELAVNDMVAECRTPVDALAGEFPQVNIRFIPGDIESLVAIPSEVDLIVANAAFQWVQDLPRLLERLCSLLSPGGVLAFGTFGPDNLSEVRAAAGHALHYYDKDSLRAMLPAGMKSVALEETRTTITFTSPREVLGHIRSTGSNALARTTWTRASLSDFERNYRADHARNGGVGLTYHPIIVVAERPWQGAQQTDVRQPQDAATPHLETGRTRHAFLPQP